MADQEQEKEKEKIQDQYIQFTIPLTKPDLKRIGFIGLGLFLFFWLYLADPLPDAVDPLGERFPLTPEGKAAIALLGDLPDGVEFHGIVGAGVQTEAAPGTLSVIQDHDPVFPFNDGRLRTHLSAVRLVTMAAEAHMVHKRQSSIDDVGPLFHHFDQPDALGSPVFLLAGHLAGPASPAGFMINKQFIGFHGLSLPLIKPPA